MRNLFCGAMLFACCNVSLAVEPAIPVPPEPSVTETAPIESVPVPTRAQAPAPSAVVPAPPTSAPAAALYCPPGVAVNDLGVWYRPEAVVPPANEGLHLRYPYYSYRRPWYPPGPASVNVTIIW
jgi:hypothetical protein